MCGIVGAIAERNIVPVLVEGLKRLEYRGYDSAGIAVVQSNEKLGLCRTVGKVSHLEAKLATEPLAGRLGVAHTRWATHGGVTEANAHPHVSGGRVAVIHNGIIENYQPLKDELIAKGYEFKSETDTEVAAHLVHEYLKQGHDLLEAVRMSVARFVGAYALLVFDAKDPDRIVVTRIASPLVIGLGIGENFVASGVPALLPVTQRFIYLEQGDIAEITRDAVRIFDAKGKPVTRQVHETQWSQGRPQRRARTGTSCSRRSSSSRARLPTRCTAASSTNASCPNRSGRAPRSCCRRCRTFTSSRAARAITPAASGAIGSSRSPGCRAKSRSRASTATAASSCRRTRCS
jgi:glucosamine--fructose-6-phosphate aminotransferase (isomerizing)